MARAAVLASEGVWEGASAPFCTGCQGKDQPKQQRNHHPPTPHPCPQYHSSASSRWVLTTVEPGKQGLQVSNLCRRREEVPVLVQHSIYGETGP